MLLSDKDLIRRVEYTEGADAIQFDPELEHDEQIQPASVDLRLGATFEDPFEGTRWRASGTVTLDPGQCLLAETVESVYVPDDLAAQATGRSTLGRQFVLIHVTAGWLDPGWNGSVTLELVNLSPVPVEIPIGKRVCQLVFHQCKTPSSGYDGQYQNADGVEGPGEL